MQGNIYCFFGIKPYLCPTQGCVRDVAGGVSQCGEQRSTEAKRSPEQPDPNGETPKKISFFISFTFKNNHLIMKKLLLFSCLLLGVFYCIPAQAQFGRMLENAINRNVNKKIDEAVDKAFEEDAKQKKDQNKSDKTEQKTNTDENEAEINENGDGNLEIKTQDSKTVITDKSIKVENADSEVTIEENNEKPVNVQPSKFIGSFDIDMTMTDKKGKQEKMLMQYYVNTYQNATLMKGEKKSETTRMIFDRQEGTITIFDDENKSAMVMKQPKVTVKSKKGQDSNKDFPNYVATGRTKIINGYTCYENIAEDEEMKMVTWITKDLDIDLTEGMNFGKPTPAQQIPTNLQGVALETTITDLKDGSTIFTQIKNIVKGKTNPDMFSTAGYQVTKMPFMGKQ